MPSAVAWLGPFRRSTLIVTGVAFFVTLVSSRLHATAFNNYVLLADAFQHGRPWITFDGDYIDSLLYHGRRYIIEGPLPALLLLPFTALFGLSANQTLLATALGAIAAGAAWELACRLHVASTSRFWLVLFFFAGTDLWWTSAIGDVWFIAHASCVCFTALALVELAGKRRAWLVALWAVCAAESRFPLVLAFPVYAYLIALDDLESPRFLPTSLDAALNRLAPATLVLAPTLVLWIGYNEARWGTILDVGYALWYAKPSVRGFFGGDSQFQLRFFPNELRAFFALGPDFRRTFPWIVPSSSGLALTWSSPALLLALFARRPRPLVLALWTATLLIATPSLFYYATGFTQFGMRHALDFEPFLFVLMLLAWRDRMPWWGAALCGYSALVGAWGVWYWETFLVS